MGAVSIRGIDDKAIARLKQKALHEGVSLNTLAARLLETEAGIRLPSGGTKVFDDLDALAGTWKASDAKAFEAATAAFSEVDESLWK